MPSDLPPPPKGMYEQVEKTVEERQLAALETIATQLTLISRSLGSLGQIVATGMRNASR